MRRAAVGISAHLGWAAVSSIAVGKHGPRVLRAERIEVAGPTDRAAVEPYHVAGGFHGLDRVPRPPNAERGLERDLRRQRRFAAKSIDRLHADLAQAGHRLAFAAILVSRGRPAATFERATGSHTQIHIEEGLAVRESLRRALVSADIRVEGVDQKAVWPIGSDELGRSEEELLSTLSALRPENDGPWRKEEKTAALTAWIAWRRGTR